MGDDAGNQKLLDELLSKLGGNIPLEDLSNSYSEQSPYSEQTPAQMHEQLLYASHRSNSQSNMTEALNSNNPHSFVNTIHDDLYPSLNETLPETNNTMPNNSAMLPLNLDEVLKTENIKANPADDNLVSFLFDLTNQDPPVSLSSSLNSEALSSSLSNSYIMPSQLLDGGHSFEKSLPSGSYLEKLRSPGVYGSPAPIRNASLNNMSSLSTNMGTMNFGDTPPSSGGANGISRTAMSKSMTEDERRKKRKEFHNAVERRRRELIKQKIRELAELIPSTVLNYDEAREKIRPNKTSILNSTVDYVRFLNDILKSQEEQRLRLLQALQGLTLEADAKGGAESAKRQLVDNTLPNVKSNPIVNSNFVKEQFYVDDFSHLDKDLQQFLSGHLGEASDNAQLMADDGQAGLDDFLLDLKKQ
ncbi:hypothetical protein TBLA_0I00930 [Henningerozyma blattae CBS 6284]|uniref:BHLH domain-containing protein n=1 Tax=Henningerozyma blattae (strain ATCC 34711 / CBS 6284 / DSM 70876 / NBRC 10599 / NRRL Y-10934 / UCD 77-7) TaxID=1071380 RepID=I2H8Q0_HENB6|nr:hypothetical protein TBLA_0I00930 [Tetrapisispora blattae CBS 6284]CCH62752.1 hypothetical protein TBLA_0I00930 [Tetrapisispora blattae CBS 6284]